jgi:lysophospholipase L1-like esterase
LKEKISKIKKVFQYTGKKQIISYVLIISIIIFGFEGIIRAYQYFGTTCTFLESDVYPDLDYFQKKQICEDGRMIKSKHVPLTEHIPNQHTSTFNINNYGFRGPDISLEKDEKTFRVFVVGSSTTRGAGSTNDSSTIAGFLQKFLEQDNLPIRIEVINAGINAYFSLWEKQLIQNKLLEFKPDLIIAYSGFADLDNSLEYHKGKYYEISFVDKMIEKTYEIVPEYQSLQTIRKIQADFRKDTQIQGVNSEINDPELIVSSEISEKVELWKQRWIEVCELGIENNFETLIFLQPIVGSGNKILSDFENTAYEKTTKHYVKEYEKFAMEINDLNTRCLGAKDLRGIFDEYSHTIQYDGIHTADEGNKIIAKNMYELVKPIIQNRINLLN